MIVAAASPLDVPRLAALHGSIFQRGWPEADFEAYVASAVCLVARERSPNSPLSGLLAATIVLDEAEIVSVGVVPAARGRGLGMRLVRAGLMALAARGVSSVHLEVAEDNAAALALYRRAGFVASGRRRAYYRLPNGEAVDAVLMRAGLPPCEVDGQAGAGA